MLSVSLKNILVGRGSGVQLDRRRNCESIACCTGEMEETMAPGDNAPVDVITVTNKELFLASRPQGMPSQSNFKVLEQAFAYTSPLQDENCAVVKILMISIDPYLREIMNEENALVTIPPFQIDKPIKALSISKVLASSIPQYKEGDYVMGLTPVSDYAYVYINPKTHFKKIDHKAGIPLGHYLGVLGLPGHTAWIGINAIGNLQAGEELFVSSASGAVGLVVGQLAKLKGCRVVGSAGSDQKVSKLKEEYKYDDAFNYKAEKDLVAALKRYFPNGFDAYFENVGGHMLEAVLENIRRKGRIIACGMISDYNKNYSDRVGVRNLMQVVGKSLRMEGFIELEDTESLDAFFEEVSQYLLDGKIKYETDVLGNGIEEFPAALVKLLKGEHSGKAVLLVSSE